MKFVFFWKELLSPVRIPAGSFCMVDDSTYAGLRESDPNSVSDLTPKPVAALFKSQPGRHPSSTLTAIPCPACHHVDEHRNIVQIHSFVACKKCMGSGRAFFPTPYICKFSIPLF